MLNYSTLKLFDKDVVNFIVQHKTLLSLELVLQNFATPTKVSSDEISFFLSFVGRFLLPDQIAIKS